MSNKNQIPFRFSDATAVLIDKGLNIYEKESKTDKLSRNQLLELCIEKAVVHFPTQVKELQNEIAKLKSKLINMEHLKDKAENELSNLKELLKSQQKISSTIDKLLNT